MCWLCFILFGFFYFFGVDVFGFFIFILVLCWLFFILFFFFFFFKYFGVVLIFYFGVMLVDFYFIYFYFEVVLVGFYFVSYICLGLVALVMFYLFVFLFWRWVYLLRCVALCWLICSVCYFCRFVAWFSFANSSCALHLSVHCVLYSYRFIA